MAHSQSCSVHGVNVILPLPWLRRLVAGLAQRRSGFDHKPIHVEFVVVKVPSGQVYIPLFLFLLFFARRQVQPHSYSEEQTDGTRCLSNVRLSFECQGARTENCFHTGFRGLSLYCKCEQQAPYSVQCVSYSAAVAFRQQTALRKNRIVTTIDSVGISGFG